MYVFLWIFYFLDCKISLDCLYFKIRIAQNLNELNEWQKQEPLLKYIVLHFKRNIYILCNANWTDGSCHPVSAVIALSDWHPPSDLHKTVKWQLKLLVLCHVAWLSDVRDGHWWYFYADYIFFYLYTINALYGVSIYGS